VLNKVTHHEDILGEWGKFHAFLTSTPDEDESSASCPELYLKLLQVYRMD
jgi:hypothetical protein